MKECPTCSVCFDDAPRFCPNDGGALVESISGSRDLDARWRLERVLRVARQGSIYAATDLETGDRAVVKTYLPTLFSEAGSFERFLGDADRLKTLDHPNAGRTAAAGRLANGGGFLAGAWIDGPTLRQVLEQGPLAVERAVEVAAALADALGTANTLGLLHRDVTPERIQFDGDAATGRPVLVDFETARWFQGSGGSSVTSTGSFVIRLPHYSSPEHCRGEAMDHRSDLYALGIVLAEMLTGKPPFDAPVPMAIIVKHVTDAPEPPGRLRAGVPPAVDAAVLRALAKMPADRFQTGGEMASALRASCGVPHPAVAAEAAQPVSKAAPEPESARKIPAPPQPLRMRMTIVDADDEENASRVIDGLVHDVGENGMRCQTGTIETGRLNVIRDHTTAFKNRLEIDVDLPTGTVHISGFAAWYKPAPDGLNWNVGIYIRDMASADRNAYAAYLRSLMAG